MIKTARTIYDKAEESDGKRRFESESRIVGKVKRTKVSSFVL